MSNKEELNKHKDVNQGSKLTEVSSSDKSHAAEKSKQETGEGDGFVPPSPDVPSAHNAREHNGPITNKNPGGRRE